ncbi:MAG: hypothetical protein AAFP20_24915, partial [Cyanobacteria bacterium J06614_10]
LSLPSIIYFLNSLSPTKLQQTNVVYKFSCPLPHSQAVEYVGFTQTSLSRRLTCHAQNGSILEHFTSDHHRRPTRDELTENTQIIDKSNTRQTLAIKEALIILQLGPVINKQFDNFSNILKLFNYRNMSNNANTSQASLSYTNEAPNLDPNPHTIDLNLHNNQETNLNSNQETNIHPNLDLSLYPNQETNLHPNPGPNLHPNQEINLHPNLGLNLHPNQATNLQPNQDPKLISKPHPALKTNLDLNLVHNLHHSLDPDLHHDLDPNPSCNLDLNLPHNLDPNLHQNLNLDLHHNLDPELHHKLYPNLHQKLDTNQDPMAYKPQSKNIQPNLNQNQPLSLPSITSMSEYELGLPDMKIILSNFGIHLSQLNTVNLKEYNWKNFNVQTPDCNLSISQRIRSLTRRAKQETTKNTTYTE